MRLMWLCHVGLTAVNASVNSNAVMLCDVDRSSTRSVGQSSTSVWYASVDTIMTKRVI